MKTFITILTILITSQFCLPQTGTIKGNIYDTVENRPVSFASLSLVDSMIDREMRVMTDINGNFIINNIPVGIYDLRISYVGYPDTTLKSIKVVQDTVTELKIKYPPFCKYDKRNKTCPICKKTDEVIPIIYGYPSKKLLKEARKGKVKLGGCLVSACHPHWYCKRDKKEF